MSLGKTGKRRMRGWGDPQAGGQGWAHCQVRSGTQYGKGWNALRSGMTGGGKGNDKYVREQLPK